MAFHRTTFFYFEAYTIVYIGIDHEILPVSTSSPPCIFRSHYQSVEFVVACASKQQIMMVLAFLSEGYLHSIPLPVRAFFGKGHKAYRQWFWVFTAWVLRWRYREDEGHPDGFPPKVNFHLRNFVWYDENTQQG